MIIGMNWLEAHSLMDLNWGDKRLSFVHHGQHISLFGVQPMLHQCYQLSPDQLYALLDHNDVHQIVQLCTVGSWDTTNGLPATMTMLL